MKRIAELVHCTLRPSPSKKLLKSSMPPVTAVLGILRDSQLAFGHHVLYAIDRVSTIDSDAVLRGFPEVNSSE